MGALSSSSGMVIFRQGCIFSKALEAFSVVLSLNLLGKEKKQSEMSEISVRVFNMYKVVASFGYAAHGC